VYTGQSGMRVTGFTKYLQRREMELLKNRLGLFLIFIFCSLFLLYGEEKVSEEKPISKEENKIVLVKKKGEVFYFDEEKIDWEELSVGSEIKKGTFLKTGKNSEAILEFGKKSAIVISQNTSIKITEALFEKKDIKEVKIRTSKGKIWSIIEQLPLPDSKFEIETPNAVAGIRGTAFLVKVDDVLLKTKVSVFKGEVNVISKSTLNSVIVKENKTTIVQGEESPTSPTEIETKEKDEWQEMINAIPMYFEVMGKSINKAKIMSAILPIRQAIKSFQATEGRNPSSLNELVETGWLDEKALKAPTGMEFNYDPKTGSVNLKEK